MVDTSVWVWSFRTRPILDELRAMAARNRLATCPPVVFELLYSARSGAEFDRIRLRFEDYPTVGITAAVWERALDVYGLLAAQGGAHQRQVSHPDLLIAAAAELAGIPVLHYDADYDRIAAVTGQETRWVRPRGSL